jgi:arsenate reductase (thioredoxin)
VKVLFVCTHNSARSQMAEAYLVKIGGGAFEAESAGIEPGTLNPYVVRALQEEGIDISGKRTRSVFDLHAAGKSYDYVITVCSKEAAERCPVFPGKARRLQWFFADPSTFTGPDEEIMNKVRGVRNAIRDEVAAFVAGQKDG